MWFRRGRSDGLGMVMARDDEHAVSLLASAEERAAAAEDRLRSQTMLIAEAEHRLKTTLSVINGWATTLDDCWEQLGDERRREAVAIIRRASQTMLTQTRQLLEEARADMVLLDLAPVRLDLREVLDATVATFGGLSHTHRIEHATDPDADVVFEVDPAALHQLLGHLLENAVKYSPPGTTVSVAARRDGHDAVIDVRDEGCGIPDAVDVFAPFQRGDNGTDGVGLGLYMARNLVRTMGGEITALRNLAGGSTFSVRLPG